MVTVTEILCMLCTECRYLKQMQFQLRAKNWPSLYIKQAIPKKLLLVTPFRKATWNENMALWTFEQPSFLLISLMDLKATRPRPTYVFGILWVIAHDCSAKFGCCFCIFLQSVCKTGRVVIAHETPLTTGFASEISATLRLEFYGVLYLTVGCLK